MALLVQNLEEKYPPVDIASLQPVDAVHILGGGVGVAMPTNLSSGASVDLYNLGPASDRVAMGARLWRMGKAREIIITGPMCGKSTPPFMEELGVTNAVVHVFETPRTTEEEARMVGATFKGMSVAVVTTAIHMRRAMMLYEKFAPEVNAIPVATDYISWPWKDDPFNWKSLVPNGDSMGLFNCVLHEYLGYWGRKW